MGECVLLRLRLDSVLYFGVFNDRRWGMGIKRQEEQERQAPWPGALPKRDLKTHD